MEKWMEVERKRDGKMEGRWRYREGDMKGRRAGDLD